MASTLTNLLYHIVFTTRKRQDLIIPALFIELYPYIGGIIREEKGKLLKIGGTSNHIHLLARFSASGSVSEMMRRVKGSSSKWVNENSKSASHFTWQRGYDAFSVSESSVGNVVSYIENQEEHHRNTTFEEKFLRLL
ncbi:MAG: IS200/IS605 family transposase [Candidatus Scalindua sp.]|jgi:REP element-mobilizing transposase RayT|nr:IS200/IS605 family transposase [Candidatus Scalindua sp.]MBT5305630.1 IS200/IS605 family transposase [Candidatus Scalindua sp.]MBT6053170.1 IS200/IS605 family transposase [Candidatus Scalindua sp.]MBT6228939.1 IS200/IS605 family transposase [Candidatus Scalindua sp.]MBT6564288.1 IS200/IS605 family transposase [Candidatus Scalindua sp.]